MQIASACDLALAKDSTSFLFDAHQGTPRGAKGSLQMPVVSPECLQKLLIASACDLALAQNSTSSSVVAPAPVEIPALAPAPVVAPAPVPARVPGPSPVAATLPALKPSSGPGHGQPVFLLMRFVA